MQVIRNNSIIVGRPDTADAISLTKSHFSLAFGEEEPPLCPYLECPCLPANACLLHRLHLREIIGCEELRYRGSSEEGGLMQPWGGFLEEVES